jgi:hypothetical protein
VRLAKTAPKVTQRAHVCPTRVEGFDATRST